MSLKEFLVELGQLIHDRAVLSCIFPNLIALDVVNELTTLNHCHPGLICNSGRSVTSHLRQHPHPALIFITEHLADGSGLELIQTLSKQNRDHRYILILTSNHSVAPSTFKCTELAGIVLDNNIGGPTCALTHALRAANQNRQFIDPELHQKEHSKSEKSVHLSEREQQVLQLAASGMSNKEVGEKLLIATTTARDHMQSVMRKLSVSNRTAAAVEGLRLGILNPAAEGRKHDN